MSKPNNQWANMLPTFKPRDIWEGSWDKPGVRTGFEKFDCPGSQGGSGKRDLLSAGARAQFLSRQICKSGSVRGSHREERAYSTQCHKPTV